MHTLFHPQDAMPTDSNTFYTGNLRTSTSDQTLIENQSDPPIPERDVGFAIGINHLDVDSRRSLRVKAYADSLRTIRIDSWADTILNSAGCTWLEVAKNDRDFQYGVFSTLDDHPSNEPKP
ncbi:hypothetical protein FRB95_001467 [Tulasnella sp. JGI-2019a]|nr:hypothetical protein FRB95_001467 [Tulasnella sp. JGI-2019a]